jgi:DNA-binding NtrC family response regulator
MMGLKVATAAGGGAALEMLARSPYAIVLLDIRMPDLDGDIIEPEHLPSFISQRQAEFQVFTEEDHILEDMEKRYLQFVLHRTKGRRQDAARILGINRKTLSLKIEKYKLRVNW